MTVRTVNIHATCVRLAKAAAPFGAPRDAGILLLGDSGAGKSDLALRLIGLGAELVADDRVDLFAQRGMLMARAPKTIAGLMEIRGLGIIELPYTGKSRVALAVVLVRKPAPRLPRHDVYAPPEALALPKRSWPPMLRLVAFESSAPQKVVAAAAAFEHKLLRDAVKPR